MLKQQKQKVAEEKEEDDSRAYFNFEHSHNSPYTKRMYIFALNKYMRYYNVKRVDDLLIHRHNPSKIEEQIIDWLVFLRKDSNFTVALKTRELYLSAVLAFYEINDVILRKKKIAKFLGEEGARKRKDRAYTTEEIKKMLDYSDIRSKVVVLILATTGMRIGALAELKIRHLKKIPEHNLYHISVYENTKDEHYSFCTPECTKAIEEYLEYRKKCGERILNTDAGEAPVIRERFDRIDIETTKKPKPLTQKGIGEILDILLARAGLTVVKHSTELHKIRQGSERKDVKRAHGFRKFFNTNLVRAKVNIAVKERLLGHSIGLDDNYLRLNEEEVLAEYLKAVDLLTINNEHRLQRKVVELTEKQDDIELMKAEQRRKDKQLEDLEKSLQAQLQTQRKQQELLESLWLHQQQEKKQQHKQKKKKEMQSPKEGDPTSATTTPVRVEKVTISRRNEPAVPPTPVAETFLLVDNDKRNNGDNRYNWFKNWSIEESPRGSWRHLPTTKEQEEKWHRAMVEGLKREQNNKNNNDNLE